MKTRKTYREANQNALNITPLAQSANQNVHTQRADGLGASSKTFILYITWPSHSVRIAATTPFSFVCEFRHHVRLLPQFEDYFPDCLATAKDPEALVLLAQSGSRVHAKRSEIIRYVGRKR